MLNKWCDIGTLVVMAALLHQGITGGLTYNVVLLSEKEVDWMNPDRTPFFVAAGILAFQASISLALYYIIRGTQDHGRTWETKFRPILQRHMSMSLSGAVLYAIYFASRTHWILEVPVMDSAALITRHFHWLMTTPMQWYIFARSCTQATDEEIAAVQTATGMMQIHGILLIFATDSTLARLCLLASCAYFVHMFVLAWKLPLQRTMAYPGRWMRWIILAVWVCYPATRVATMMGCMSLWTEQVVMYSLLDVISKVITFSGILLTRAIMWFSHMNGELQVALSASDYTLIVNEHFQQISDLPAASPLASIFCDASEGAMKDRGLHDLCINEEHKARFLQAAKVADINHLGCAVPKVVVAFRSPLGDGELLVECFLSKCIHGQRVVAITIACQNFNMPMQEDGINAEPIEADQLTDNMKSASVQMMCGIQNCSQTLGFNARRRSKLTNIFLQPHVASALIVWADGVEKIAPTIVVASPLLQTLYFPSETMPQPLLALLDAALLQNMLHVLTERDVALHQWQMQSIQDRKFSVTMLPLNRLSCEDAESQVELFVISLEAEKCVSTRGRSELHFRWSLSPGGGLACACQSDGETDRWIPKQPPQLMESLALDA